MYWSCVSAAPGGVHFGALPRYSMMVLFFFLSRVIDFLWDDTNMGAAATAGSALLASGSAVWAVLYLA